MLNNIGNLINGNLNNIGNTLLNLLNNGGGSNNQLNNITNTVVAGLNQTSNISLSYQSNSIKKQKKVGGGIFFNTLLKVIFTFPLFR